MSAIVQKIAQMIMTGIDGCELTREQESLLRAYPFGGYILFSHNCREPGQILSLCRSLRKATDGQPPFIAIDQEGGRVQRCKEGLEQGGCTIPFPQREVHLVSESAKDVR